MTSPPLNFLFHRLTVGWLETNCYLFGDPTSRETVIIDPGAEPEKIIAMIQKEKLHVVALINTHGHADHIGGNQRLVALTGAPLLIHAADQPMLANPALNLSQALNTPTVSPQADRFVKEGDQINIGRLRLTVMETPGHTPGGISLVGDGLVFTGDTLFAGSIGRTDLPGSHAGQIRFSLFNRLLLLDPACQVFPGHGPASTVGHEKKYNPFLI